MLLHFQHSPAINMPIPTSPSSPTSPHPFSANSLRTSLPVALLCPPISETIDRWEMEMTATTMVQKANSPTLKRAFVPDLVPNTSFRAKKSEKTFVDRNCRQAFHTQSPCPAQT